MNDEDTRDRLGEAILASDRSVTAITEIMRGVGHGVFSRMDRSDNWGGVPEWHPYRRRWRSSCRNLFAVLNDRSN